MFHHVFLEGVLGPEEESSGRGDDVTFVALAPDLLDTLLFEHTFVLLQEQFCHFLEIEVIGDLIMQYLPEGKQCIILIKYQHMLIPTGHLFTLLGHGYRFFLIYMGDLAHQRHGYSHIALGL